MTEAGEERLKCFRRHRRQIGRHHLDKQAQIMSIGLDGIDRNRTLAEAHDKGLNGIGRSWGLVRHDVFLLPVFKYHITRKTAHATVE